MLRNHLLCLIAGIVTFVSATPARAADDEDQIRKTVDNYIVGWREGDVDRLSEVFALDEGRVMWIAEGEGEENLASMTFGAVIQHRRPQPEFGIDWRILTLDVIDGKLAVAKVSIACKGESYIDVLVLQKISSIWRIVNKTFVLRAE